MSGHVSKHVKASRLWGMGDYEYSAPTDSDMDPRNDCSDPAEEYDLQVKLAALRRQDRKAQQDGRKS